MCIIAFTKGKEITSRNINLSPCILQFKIDYALWLIMYFSIIIMSLLNKKPIIVLTRHSLVIWTEIT